MKLLFITVEDTEFFMPDEISRLNTKQASRERNLDTMPEIGPQSTQLQAKSLRKYWRNGDVKEIVRVTRYMYCAEGYKEMSSILADK